MVDEIRSTAYSERNLINAAIKYILIFAVAIVSGCNENTVTLESLLSEMISRETLTRFPVKEYKLFQAGSYNRASVRPGEEGWFANNDMSHFVRVENNSGRREFVLMDTDGPGAIVRWWMTFYKAQNGIIRVYIDKDTIPSIEGPPADLLSGNMLCGPPLAVSLQAGAPPGEEGRDYDHNLYLPVPFSEHCKVTYECDSLRLLYEYEGIKVDKGYYWPDVFYNICFRLYLPGTKVESFSRTALKNAGKLIAEVNSSLSEVPHWDKTSLMEYEKLITPGDSLVICINGKNKAICGINVIMKCTLMNQALRSMVLTGKFDGNKTIWVPVGEFFGTGYSLNTHRTWMNEKDEAGNLKSFWIMPFRETSDLTFINYGNEPVLINCFIDLKPYIWTSGSMYFGSSWHEYNNIRTRDGNNSPFDLNFIDLNGKGLYAGDQITIFNPDWHWWGEGDEKIFVDGESFPSSFGTGTEDYYGYSFGREEPFSHPFLSQPEGKGNMSGGLTVNMRLRSLDAIPFTRSVSSNIELWHWADIRMNYALTSFYYIQIPYTSNILSDRESVKKPVGIIR